MKTNIATSRSQSERLLACGVSADTADMYYLVETLKIGPVFPDIWKNKPKEINPAWSLSRLLELMPTSILGWFGNEYILELSKVRMRDAWEVQWIYGHNRFATYDKQSKPRKLHKLWAKSPIEACVKAIEWLTASGHKLNENK